LIATTPRCGSHFLGHALSTGGRLGFPLEYINRGNLYLWRDRFRVDSDTAALEQLFRHRTGPSGFFGLKAHWVQFKPFCDHPLLSGPHGIQRAVWLTRRNRLAQAISYVIATQTGQFISGAGKRGQARFDYDMIVRCARSVQKQNEAWQQYFAEHRHLPLLHVVFEELMADLPRGLATITGFLDPAGEPAAAPHEKTQRQSDTTAADWAKAFRAAVREDDRWILEPCDIRPLQASVA
jgi:LPS sulfotransferase NodH